ncbi:hypothetical protein BDM02DRAFT_3185302 [Thelephora ganbajun]|uniref:Uncharacterized protein n=1 Tax=Thelephora ganbajun TaxID=370292 RepID=A0ACB6ZM27_THEGA|nr:hypothetical protein BDM02DRAFT_3185302 [Thelephora ganbajun]
MSSNSARKIVYASGRNLVADGFYPVLLSNIHSAAPDLPLDPVVFRSLLLCILASGGRNLLFRSSDEDVSLIQNITALTLSKAFGFPTQKVRIRSRHSPSDFLHSLFLNDKFPPRRPGGRRPVRSIPRTSSEPNELPNPTPLSEGNSFDGASGRQTVPERRPQVRLPESHTDPQISLGDVDTVSVISSDSPSLPKAVVITGLEYAGTAAQRTLLQVLSDQSFVLEDDPDTVWKLPPDFMVVYVCVNDAWERPKIHQSLLDRFAMSVSVLPSTSTRQSFSLVRSEMQAPPINPSPIISPSDISYLRSLSVYVSPSLSLYVDELFTAARHHHELDGTLLTSRAHRDAESLIRAQRLLSGDSTSTELIRSYEMEDKAEGESSDGFIDPDNDLCDLAQPLRHDSWLARGRIRTTVLSENGLDSTRCTDNTFQLESQRMDVSEVDIARIIPRVLTHRLRVRDGPDHEVLSSVVFPAVLTGCDKVESHRRTVKEILVQIIGET